jgi:hypothetical protein
MNSRTTLAESEITFGSTQKAPLGKAAAPRPSRAGSILMGPRSYPGSTPVDDLGGNSSRFIDGLPIPARPKARKVIESSDFAASPGFDGQPFGQRRDGIIYFSVSLSLRSFEAHTRASTVLVDELDARLRGGDVPRSLAQYVGHRLKDRVAVDHHRRRQVGGDHHSGRSALSASATHGGEKVLALRSRMARPLTCSALNRLGQRSRRSGLLT